MSKRKGIPAKISIEEVAKKLRQMPTEAGETLSSSTDKSDAMAAKAVETESTEESPSDQTIIEEVSESEGNENEKPEELKEEFLTDEMKTVLGEDPSEEKGLQLELHPKIKNRLKFWTEKGLSNDDRDKLLTKYKRSEGFEAPKINLAIEAKLSVSAKKRDTFRVLTQNSIGSALMAVGSVASSLMTETESLDVDDAFEKLFEASKILADAFHQQSLSRKATITPAFDKTTKEILEKAKADEYLFGKDLVENIKTVKAADEVVSAAKAPVQAAGNQGRHLNSYRPVGRRSGPYQQGSWGQGRPRLPFRQNQRFQSRQNQQLIKNPVQTTKPSGPKYKTQQ